MFGSAWLKQAIGLRLLLPPSHNRRGEVGAGADRDMCDTRRIATPVGADRTAAYGVQLRRTIVTTIAHGTDDPSQSGGGRRKVLGGPDGKRERERERLSAEWTCN